MLTRIFLIRHGTTSWNKQRRYCGCRDISLCDEGKAQARKLHGQLKGISFDAIYSSDRKRVLQTCRIVFNKTKPTRLSALREINFGVLEGLRHSQIMQKYGQLYENWLKDPYKNNLPKAEPMPVFKRRVRTALTKIARINRGKTIAVVCHGGVIGVYISSIKKSRDFWRYVPKATSVTVVEHKRGKPLIRKFNDIAHLSRQERG
jgi:broad specificity phosphatase PhoE